MTQDEIIEMARQTLSKDIDGLWLAGTPDLEAFAKLVDAKATAKEREACAKVLDDMAEQMIADMEPSTAIAWVRNRAEFIRARGEA